MIELDEALSLVLEHAVALPPVHLPFRDSLGLVLAEDVVSDVDSPPHDKALMDGYAVVATDLRELPAELQVLEEVTAGHVPQHTVRPGCATRLMTGAPLPAGADAVVASEETELLSSGPTAVVRILDHAVQPGQHIMRRGRSVRRGETVLRSGRTLTAIDLGLLAEIGRCDVLVHPRPRVAVLATGTELVPADQSPGPGRIRNSNGPMLCALTAMSGATAVDLGIGRDDRDELARRIALGLQEDVLVLSGGVSAGVADLVPPVMAAVGVEEVFHKVRLKPGKPVWFGVWKGGGRPRLVFGLPGNPVSTLVCFELFVATALRALAGGDPRRADATTATLARDAGQRGNRTTYFPGRLAGSGGRLTVEPLDWHGSADLRTLADANCLIVFPAGHERFAAGTELQVLPLGGCRR